jgi:predicted O-methyltransferase YrrM
MGQEYSTPQNFVGFSPLASEFDRFYKVHKGMHVYYPLIYSLVVSQKTQMAFEFGIGFSTKVILTALQDTRGLLVSCDQRGLDALKNIDQRGWDISLSEELMTRWKFIHGESHMALKYLKQDDKFDFVLHDGSHDLLVVQDDIATILPRIRPNGILLIHDVLDPRYNLLGGGIFIPPSRKHEKITLPNYNGLEIIRFL